MKDAAPRYTRRYVNIVVAMLTGAVFVEFYHRQILAVAMDKIGKEFALSDSQLGSLVTAFAVSYAVCGPLLGRLADRVPRRGLYVAGISAWSVATLLGGYAGSFASFFVTRLGTGAGQASAGATNSPLIVDYVAPAKRGTAMAIATAGATVGALAAGALGFAGVVESFGWRALFIGSSVFGFVFAAAFFAIVKEPPRGWSEGRDYTPAAPVPLREIIAVLGRRPALLQTYLGTVLVSVGVFASAQWVVAFFERVHGMSNSRASLGLVWAAIAGTIGAVAGGVVANRAWTTSPRAVLLTPAACAFLACPALFFGATTENATLAVVLYSLAGGLSLVHAAPAAAAMQGMIPDRMRGFVSSLIASLLTLIGLGGGPFLAGALSDYFGSATNPASLGTALSAISVLYLWAAVHFVLASRTLKRDLELNAREA